MIDSLLFLVEKHPEALEGGHRPRPLQHLHHQWAAARRHLWRSADQHPALRTPWDHTLWVHNHPGFLWVNKSSRFNSVPHFYEDYRRKTLYVLSSLKWKRQKERRPSRLRWWTLLSRWRKSLQTASSCPGHQLLPPSQASGWSTSSVRKAPRQKPWVRPFDLYSNYIKLVKD